MNNETYHRAQNRANVARSVMDGATRFKRRVAEFDSSDSGYLVSTRVVLFCHEYLIDFNGTRAARAVGYSPAGAHVSASRLLHKPMVRAYLSNLMNERARRLDAQGDKFLMSFVDMATSPDCSDTKRLKGTDRLGRLAKLLHPSADPKSIAEQIVNYTKAMLTN